MKKFAIAIEETIAAEFEVEADTAQEALFIAKEKYENGEFVLSPGEVQSKQLSIVRPCNETSEWVEF